MIVFMVHVHQLQVGQQILHVDENFPASGKSFFLYRETLAVSISVRHTLLKLEELGLGEANWSQVCFTLYFLRKTEVESSANKSVFAELFRGLVFFQQLWKYFHQTD